MGSSVQYNRTLKPYLRSRGRENEVINNFCHAPFSTNYLVASLNAWIRLAGSSTLYTYEPATATVAPAL